MHNVVPIHRRTATSNVGWYVCQYNDIYVLTTQWFIVKQTLLCLMFYIQHPTVLDIKQSLLISGHTLHGRFRSMLPNIDRRCSI